MRRYVPWLCSLSSSSLSLPRMIAGTLSRVGRCAGSLLRPCTAASGQIVVRRPAMTSHVGCVAGRSCRTPMVLARHCSGSSSGGGAGAGAGAGAQGRSSENGATGAQTGAAAPPETVWYRFVDNRMDRTFFYHPASGRSQWEEPPPGANVTNPPADMETPEEATWVRFAGSDWRDRSGQKVSLGACASGSRLCEHDLCLRVVSDFGGGSVLLCAYQVCESTGLCFSLSLAAAFCDTSPGRMTSSVATMTTTTRSTSTSMKRMKTRNGCSGTHWCHPCITASVDVAGGRTLNAVRSQTSHAAANDPTAGNWK